VQLRLAEHYITRLSEDLGQMQRSKSWRWAAPFRGLGKLARRIRHPRDTSYRSLGEGVVPPPDELTSASRPTTSRPERA
jgi:hypothetical protein